MATGSTLLSLMIWIPIIGGIGVLLAGNHRPAQARWLALLISLFTFFVSISLYMRFDVSLASMQFQEFVPWIEIFSINYALGVDGFAVPLILLTTFFGVIVVIAGWEVIQKRVHQYMASFLILEGLMVGVFCALDAFLFYVFFEAMLIPMFLVIGMWGGPKRVYATMKFFLYTFFGSVFMLIGLIYLYIHSGSWDILAWHELPLSLGVQKWLFLAFLAAFAVKIPMWPVHTWLPDAHVEAPTGGSVILAAIMLKVGGYGFIRFSLPIAPDASNALDWLVIALSLIAIVYIGFVALAQQDMKKLIAYSSISHMGFVTLGLFIAFSIYRNTGGVSGAALGVEGAMVQMISHGFISGALFLCVGVIYDRMHTREIDAYGGLVNRMPAYALIFMFFTMANVGLPGTSGFVGEFLTLVGIFQVNTWVAAVATSGVILSAAYALWLYRRVVMGDLIKESLRTITDMGTRERVIFAPLVFMTLLLGVYPALVLDITGPSVAALVVNYETAVAAFEAATQLASN